MKGGGAERNTNDRVTSDEREQLTAVARMAWIGSSRGGVNVPIRLFGREGTGVTGETGIHWDLLADLLAAWR